MHVVSPTWLPKHDLNKDNISRHANMDRGPHKRPQPQAKNYRQPRKLDSERNNEHIGYPISNNQSSKHAHTSDIKWNEQDGLIFFLRKRNHGFKRECGKVYRRVWSKKKKRKGDKNLIML